MYKAIFKYNFDSLNNERKTILFAKFRFDKEINDLNKNFIKERTNLNFNAYDKDRYGKKQKRIMDGLLTKFLRKDLGYEKYNKNKIIGQDFEGFKEMISIKPAMFSIGFNLCSIASGYMPKKEMINLDAINHYVLTDEKIETIMTQNDFRDLYYKR